jgi:hypothetical protein
MSGASLCKGSDDLCIRKSVLSAKTPQHLLGLSLRERRDWQAVGEQHAQAVIPFDDPKPSHGRVTFNLASVVTPSRQSH